MATTAPPPTNKPPMTPAPPAVSLVTTLGRIAAAVALVAFFVWAVRGLQFNFTHLGTGLGSGRDYVARMFPHSADDWKHDRLALPDLMQPLRETVQMAVVGTLLGALLAFPISFLAARTGYVPRPISGAIKTALNVSRSVPTFIYAIVVVNAIGLGASAGAIAIAFVSFISLSKLYAETLESVSVGPIEAVRAAGGNAAQVFVYGMMPQVFPVYLSTTLFTLEYNFRDSFIVGIVGAGGLGYALINDLRIYQLLDAGVIVLLMILLVNLVDYFSYRVRRIFA